MINDNPLDVKNLFGKDVPVYSKKVEPTIELPQVAEPTRPERIEDRTGGLVAATIGGIYLLLPDGKVIYAIANAVKNVNAHDALCQYGDELYVAAHYDDNPKLSRISAISHESLHDSSVIRFVRDIPRVNALCEFEGNLFGGGPSGLAFIKDGGRSSEHEAWPHSAQSRSINAMCVYDEDQNSKLLCGGEDGIWATYHNLIFSSSLPTAMCSFKGTIHYNDLNRSEGRHIEIRLDDNSLYSVVRQHPVTVMCTDGEHAYDGGAYGDSGESGAVYKTLIHPAGKDPLWVLNKPVTALAYVRGKIWEAMVNLR